MCFSAEADLVAAGIVGIVAFDSMRHVRRPAEFLLAALPVVFAAHALVETFVWWGLEGTVTRAVWRPAAWVYLVVAFAVLPVLVPLAVGALEPVASRRRIWMFTGLGTGVALLLTTMLVRGSMDAVIEGHHIAYHVDLWQGPALALVYVLVTCGSLLLSGRKQVRAFGAINLLAVGLLAWFDRNGFVSLWCAWAAVTSVAIAVHLRHATREPSDVRFVRERPGLC